MIVISLVVAFVIGLLYKLRGWNEPKSFVAAIISACGGIAFDAYIFPADPAFRQWGLVATLFGGPMAGMLAAGVGVVVAVLLVRRRGA